MNFTDYQREAKRTAKELNWHTALMHAGMGVSGEAGELNDAIKRHTIYGKTFDIENYCEEIGDLLWFCAYAASVVDRSLAEIAEANINKLRVRFPDAYTDFHARARLDKIHESD